MYFFKKFGEIFGESFGINMEILICKVIARMEKGNSNSQIGTVLKLLAQMGKI